MLYIRTKWLLLPLLLIFCSACDSNGESDPEAEILGSWSLIAVNGTPVPGSIRDPDDPDSRFTIEDGTLIFNNTGTWTFSITVESETSFESETSLFTGDYAVSGDNLSVVWTGFDGSDSFEELLEEGASLALREWSGDEMTLVYALDGDPEFVFGFSKF